MEIVLQEWKGHVIEFIEKAVFIARLKDLTNGGTDEMVQLGFDDISEEYWDLIEVGSVFHWMIGFEHVESLKPTSKIKFYKNVQLDENEIKQALERAELLLKHLKID